MNEPDLNTAAPKPERRILLDGAANFRDIGGYPALDHKRVKWRSLFRSGHLASLTDSDRRVLNNLGIRSICDFRSKQEIQSRPNRLPKNAYLHSLHFPIVSTAIEPTQAISMIMKGDTSWFTQDFMIKAYIEKIETFYYVWHRFFKLLAQRSSRPLLFHCTAGKDRTGVCAALILLCLGVSEEWVIHDHGLSNTYNAKGIQKMQATLRKIEVDPDKLRDYITAPKTAMQAVIEHIHKKYGSTKNYLIQKANVAPAWIETLQAELID